MYRATMRAVAMTLCLGLGIVVAGGTGMASQDRPAAPYQSDVEVKAEVDPRSPVPRLMKRFDCSTVGYGDGSTPLSAIVQRPGGKFDVVTFDEGWRVHISGGPAELIAVCLEPPR